MHPSPLQAGDLMTREVVSVPPDMPVLGLARLLAERSLSSVPVADRDGRLVGIVTEADLLRRLASAEDRPLGWLRARLGDPAAQAAAYARTHGLVAGDVMTRDLVTAAPTDTAAHCAQLMEQRRIKRLPVLEDGRLVGVVSRADLLRALLTAPAPAAGGRDEAIRAALRREMRAQPWADSFYVHAEVKDGVVTLYGFFRNEEVRRAMRVLASRVAGVSSVEDRMEPAPMILFGEMV